MLSYLKTGYYPIVTIPVTVFFIGRVKTLYYKYLNNKYGINNTTLQ